MIKQVAFLFLSLLLASTAKTKAQVAQSMPGKQHDMEHMDQMPRATQSGQPAVPTEEQTPLPDLLMEAKSRPPLSLEQLQQYALAGNPTLQQAQALVRLSAGQAQQVGLYPNPVVGYQGEQIRAGAYGGGEQGAFVQQSIILGGKLHLRRSIYDQQVRIDEIGVSEQRYRVLSDIGQSFYAALAAQEIVNVRRQLLSLATDVVQTAHQLANVGQADAPDVLQAEVEGETASIDYITAQRTYIQLFRTLSALAGKVDLPIAPLAGQMDKLPALDENQVLEQVIHNSPEVKRAGKDVLRAEAELKSARREAVPDVQLRAGVQQNLERLVELSPRTVGMQAFVSAGINVPLFNRNQGNIAAARADLDRAKQEVNRIQLSARRSAQPLLSAYLSGQIEANRYKSQIIPRARRAYELYRAKYSEMGAAYPQVLVSQRTLFQLQVSYINALQNIWSNAIALQNFMLTDSLAAPTSSSATATTLNLPNSGAAGAP